MRIPDPWTAVLLMLAAFRLLRFVSWDDWPPIYKARAWVIGERWVPVGAIGRIEDVKRDPDGNLAVAGTLTDLGRKVVQGDDLTPELPGKQPPSEVEGVRPSYRRPLLAHLIHCPFCMGWWICLIGWLAWLAWPHAVTWAAVPWAASGVIGLIAKNLDP